MWNTTPSLRDLPNAITIARIVSVVPLAWLLLNQRYPAALMLAFVAGASDGIDGWLAKRFGWVSRIGSLLDPIADKLLLGVCLTVLALQGHVPIWLLLLVLARDVLIVAGATAFNYLVSEVEGEPSLLSKLNTVVQIGLVLVVLVHLALAPHWPLGIQYWVWATAITTVASGAHYVWLWGGRARRISANGSEQEGSEP